MHTLHTLCTQSTVWHLLTLNTRIGQVLNIAEILLAGRKTPTNP